jgi:transcriptional regulator with XRE-family HTH domain
LEARGYRASGVEEFLGLSKEESEYIELKLALCQALSHQRKESTLTQTQLARKLGSSQSRVAKMEKGDPTVSLDLIVKSLLAMGATKKDIAMIPHALPETPKAFRFTYQQEPVDLGSRLFAERSLSC